MTSGMKNGCVRCGYDLSGTNPDRAGARLCPECAELNGGSAVWLVRDRNFSRDALLACVLAIGVPALTQPIVFLVARRDSSAIFAGVFICALAGIVSAIALPAWRVLAREHRAEQTFSATFTVLCCGLPAALLSCIFSVVLGVVLSWSFL